MFLFLVWLIKCDRDTYIYTSGLTWKVFDYDEDIYSACITHNILDDTIWLCGGRDLSKYRTCRHIKLNINGWYQISKRKKVRYNTIYPNIYHTTSQFSCSNQNYGGYYDNKYCMLNQNIGKTYSQCLCCQLNDGFSAYKCNQLGLNGECPGIFQSCIFQDLSGNDGRYMYHSGGKNSDGYNGTILKFDIQNEKFMDGSEYGTLKVSTWMSGCGKIFRNNNIIVVGGDSRDGNYLDTIQICNKYDKECILSTQVLPIGVENPRVINIRNDPCKVLIIGGYINGYTTTDQIVLYNGCTDEILNANEYKLPMPMAEFALYLSNDNVLCTIGGITDRADVIDKIFCADLKVINGDNAAENARTRIYFICWKRFQDIL